MTSPLNGEGRVTELVLGGGKGVGVDPEDNDACSLIVVRIGHSQVDPRAAASSDRNLVFVLSPYRPSVLPVLTPRAASFVCQHRTEQRTS